MPAACGRRALLCLYVNILWAAVKRVRGYIMVLFVLDVQIAPPLENELGTT